jgi:hypothetical protein
MSAMRKPARNSIPDALALVGPDVLARVDPNDQARVGSDATVTGVVFKRFSACQNKNRPDMGVIPQATYSAASAPTDNTTSHI